MAGTYHIKEERYGDRTGFEVWWRSSNSGQECLLSISDTRAEAREQLRKYASPPPTETAQ